MSIADSDAPGLRILQLLKAPESKDQELLPGILDRAKQEPDCDRQRAIIELIEELLLRRHSQLDREEVRRMFHLNDLRKSRVWQEAHQEGIQEGMEKGVEKGQALAQRQYVQRWLAKGKSVKEIAELLELPVREIRRLARRQ